MAKFSKHLQEYQVRRWKDHYLPYDTFKKLLAEIEENGMPSRSSATSSPRRNSQLMSPSLGSRRNSQSSPLGIFRRGSNVNPLLDADLPADPIEAWQTMLEKDIIRIGRFVDAGLKELEDQAVELSRMVEGCSTPAPGIPVADVGAAQTAAESGAVPGDASMVVITHPESLESLESSNLESWRLNVDEMPPDSEVMPSHAAASSSAEPGPRPNILHDELLELRVLKAVGAVQDGAAQLRSFAELNHAALYKVLKKHDKTLKRNDGLTVILPRLVSLTQLDDTTRWEVVDATLRDITQRCTQCENIAGTTPTVLQLANGIVRGQPGASRQNNSSMANDERLLFFFLGTCIAFCLSIIVLIALPIPQSDTETYNPAYFLAPFPVFRVFMSVMLVLWGLGAVALICDQHHINATFVLNIDPRCRVGPRKLFAMAAFLTTFWILIWGMYVVDYKWAVLPEIQPEKGYNKHASLHYVFYPLILIAIGFGLIVHPSRTCSYRYRINILKSVGRTLLAPLFMVSFLDNIVGDVLTSLAKPLADIPPAFCYLFSAHPQTQAAVERFTDHGDTCEDWEHHFLKPCLVALPYVCRSMQCLRRYYDTKQRRHLVNFGKYVASILIVLVSALRPSDSVSVIGTSVIATAYAFAWDVMMDWGLNRHDFRNMISNRLPEASSNDSPKRTFYPRTYGICAVLDMFMRLAWVNTLMPLEVTITSDVNGREIWKTLLTAIEILRRSMWAVLRIEWEQIANASGFRVLLWVPDRLTAKSALLDSVSIDYAS